ncbi:DUF7342 family protein [Halosimplex pelagicum]|uniref:DUF7342 family protein n=1 Tax=Halosimplex pelagicum TaxID=869886 RepID=UPI003CCD5524
MSGQFSAGIAVCSETIPRSPTPISTAFNISPRRIDDCSSSREGRAHERDDSCFEWRRISRLASEYSREELQSEVRTLTERIQTYEQRYDAAAPADIDAIIAAEEDEQRNIDDVYSDLGDWATALRERRYHECARQQLASTNETEQVSGQYLPLRERGETPTAVGYRRSRRVRRGAHWRRA